MCKRVGVASGEETFCLPQEDNTPLHLAALNGNTEAAGALIVARADVKARNKVWREQRHMCNQEGTSKKFAKMQ